MSTPRFAGGIFGGGKTYGDKMYTEAEVNEILKNVTGGLPSKGPMYGWNDYINPASSRNLQLGWTEKEHDLLRSAAVQDARAMMPIIEGAKQREFQRNMAAARYRAKIGTEANMAQQSQLGAQAMGQQAQSSALGALSANYQYR